jgi:hypothetical protein
MTPGDVGAVAALSRRVFHKTEAPPSAELVAYVRDLAFGAPAIAGPGGGLVHLAADGAIDAAVLTIPLRLMVGERLVAARILSTFMAEEGAGHGRPGARLAMNLARSDRFFFTDTAKPISAGLFEALGGTVLPIHSLEWLRILRPAGFLARLAERRRPGLARLPFDAIAGGLDRIARRVFGMAIAAPAADRLEEIDTAEFAALAPAFVAHRTIRPVWSPEELGWTIAMARRRTHNGPLRLCRIVDGHGETIGVTAHYAGPGRIALLLELLARPDREAAVVAALLADLDRVGVVAVRGACRPGLIEALYRVPGVIFRHNAHAVCLTRMPAAREAIGRGDVHLGGLAGETWSRLIADRF